MNPQRAFQRLSLAIANMRATEDEHASHRESLQYLADLVETQAARIEELETENKRLHDEIELMKVPTLADEDQAAVEAARRASEERTAAARARAMQDGGEGPEG